MLGAPQELPPIFPSWTSSYRSEEWPSNRNAASVDADTSLVQGGVCLTVDEPNCSAVARLLADRAGRRLVVSGADQWSGAVRAALEAADGPVAMILPLWGKDGALDPTLLDTTISAARVADPWSEGAPWGLVTGPRPTELSVLAAKALLPDAALRAWSYAPSALCLLDGSGRAPLPRWPRSIGSPGLSLFDSTNLDAATTAELLHRYWSALVFVGHGRSYCACDGFLCGARALDDQGTVPRTTCGMGLDCVDAHFPRIDPRRYAASLLVLDTCGAVNPAAVTWPTVPALAVHASLGAARGVVASDTNTVHGDPLDALRAFRSTPTLGAATRRFNRSRRPGNVPAPYVLIGDPGVACPPGWRAWDLPVSATATAFPASSIHVRRPPSVGSEGAAAALEATLSRSPPSAWPWELWGVQSMGADIDKGSCPVCGRTPTVVRRYVSYGEPRSWRECLRCAIVSDPADGVAGQLRLDGPDRLAVGERATATVRLLCTPGAGACALFVSTYDHGVLITPSTALIGGHAGGTVDFQLVLPVRPPVAHIYFLRAVAVVDERWLWASRPLVLGGQQPNTPEGRGLLDSEC